MRANSSRAPRTTWCCASRSPPRNPRSASMPRPHRPIATSSPRNPGSSRPGPSLSARFMRRAISKGRDAALAEGLEVLPEGLNLLWAQASFLEQRGEYEAAIAIYEIMYERAPEQPVIANNLASLISTYRDDPESLERAYAVARRLRGADFGPFQDTYGWIAYRRGEYQDALDHLEPAAAALADDPLVQFHLGMTYAGGGAHRGGAGAIAPRRRDGGRRRMRARSSTSPARRSRGWRRCSRSRTERRARSVAIRNARVYFGHRPRPGFTNLPVRAIRSENEMRAAPCDLFFLRS